MNLEIPANSIYGVWMRAPSSSGGKDWLGFVTDAVVISQWGKTGMVQQSKAISGRPSMPDLVRKVEEKKAKGYRVVGEYRPGRGWSHLPSISEKPSLPPSALAEQEKVASWLSQSDGQVWF